MDKNTTSILLLTVSILLFVIPESAPGKLYRYSDDEGIANYTTRPKNVPEKFQDGLKLVEDPVHKMTGIGANLADRYVKCSRENWLIFSPARKAIGVNLQSVLLHCFIESMLIFWLGVEMILYITLMVLLLRVKRWWRYRYRSKFKPSLYVLSGYLIIAALVFFLFVMPSYKQFLAVSRYHLVMISDQAELEKSAEMHIDIWDQKFKSDQRRLQ